MNSTESIDRFQLTSNDTLNAAAEILRSTDPDWDRLMETILNGPTKHRDAKPLRGDLAETHVMTTLQDAIDKEQLPGQLNLHAISEDTTAGEYDFFIAKSGLLYARTNNKDNDLMVTVKEFDAVVEAKDPEGKSLIANIEVRVTKNRQMFNDMFRQKTIDRTFTPLEQLFERTTFGYLAIANSDIARNERTRRGVLIAGMPITLAEFQEKAEVLSQAAYAKYPQKRPRRS
jgi:hypothetical protein